MFRVIVLYAVLALCLVNVYSISLGSSSDSEEEQEKNILESMKEFVRIVDKYNLNVSIIGSHNKYRPNGEVKESVSVIMHMPVNDAGKGGCTVAVNKTEYISKTKDLLDDTSTYKTLAQDLTTTVQRMLNELIRSTRLTKEMSEEEFLTEATLDAGKQEKYLTKLEKIASKENVGAKTRVIQFQNREDWSSLDEQSVNSEYLIDSPSYESFAKYKNGKTVFDDMENRTSIVLQNYIINNVSENGVKNVQVITSNVIISDKDVTDDFPTEVLDEIKQVLPKLWLSTSGHTILARLLVEHLDKKFDGNFQALVGADKFALSGKAYAYLDVADTNVVVFNLA